MTYRVLYNALTGPTLWSTSWSNTQSIALLWHGMLLILTATYLFQLTHPSFCAIALIALVSFLVPPDRLLLIVAIAINSITFVMAQITCKSSHSPNAHAMCWFFSQHYCSSRNYPLYVFHPYTKIFLTKSYLKVYLISAVSMWAHSTTTLEKCLWQTDSSNSRLVARRGLREYAQPSFHITPIVQVEILQCTV